MKQAVNEVHQLEMNETEKEWFSTACSNYRTAYRRAVLACTERLPTWAEGKTAGRPQSISTEHHEEIRRLLVLGVPLTKVARQFGTSPATIIRIRDAEELKAGADGSAVQCPESFSAKQRDEILELLALDVPVAVVARQFGTSEVAIVCIRDAEEIQ